MKRLSLILSLLFAVSFTCAAQSSNDSTYAVIKGQVLYKKRKPLANAAVKLSLGGIVKAGVVTDDNGNYTLKLVPAGTYTLTVMYMGYKDETVEQITITEGQTLIQNITMTTPSNIDIYRTGGPMFNNVSIDMDNPGNRTIKSNRIEQTAH